NDDILHNLHLFANPLMTDIPDKNNRDVIYFGPGIHTFEDNKFEVPSNCTVYVDGGAILRGHLLAHNVKNVKIICSGMAGHKVQKILMLSTLAQKSIRLRIINLQCHSTVRCM